MIERNEIELLEIIKRALNAVKKELKTSHYGSFRHRRSTHGIDLCTGIDSWGRPLWHRIKNHYSVSLTCTATEVDSWGRPLWACQPKIACHSVSFDRSRLIGSTQFFKLKFLSTYPSKKYEITSNRSQIFYSCS